MPQPTLSLSVMVKVLSKQPQNIKRHFRRYQRASCGLTAAHNLSATEAFDAPVNTASAEEVLAYLRDVPTDGGVPIPHLFFVGCCNRDKSSSVPALPG